MPERREEEAALALGAQGEGHPRQIQDRHAFEIHTRGLARANARARIQRDALCAQLPRGVVARAGGEAHVVELDEAFGRHLHRFGRAARGPLAQLEPGIAERGALGGRIAAATAGGVDDRIVELDVAFDLEGVAFLAVFDIFRANLAIALPNGDLALQVHGAVYSDFRLIRLEVDGRIVRRAGLRGRRRGAGRDALCGLHVGAGSFRAMRHEWQAR
jgi:hypothetical protein